MSPATYSVTTTGHTYHVDEASYAVICQAIFDGVKIVEVRTASDSMFDGEGSNMLTLVVAHIEALVRHEAGCDDIGEDPTEVAVPFSHGGNVIQFGRGQAFR